MKIDDYDFELPDELIAQQPPANRGGSRMLTVDRESAAFADKMFVDLPQLLRPNDVIVLNNTRVFPARLLGRTDTGAAVETFLVEELSPRVWSVLARPAKRLKPGRKIFFGDELSAEFVERLPDGKVVLEYQCDGDFDEIVQNVGRTPLPPYIRRDEFTADTDAERYQTVFAQKRGAIAAPTAGLHFTPETLSAIRERGIETAEITLHVGYGTFEPVRADDLKYHRVAAERFEIDQAAAETLEKARVDGRRLIAIGTTTTRTLEYSLNKNDKFVAQSGKADLTITPGYRFRAVGGLLTNFHLPKSSLLVLTACFGGYETIMNAYRHAINERYRFYSYGDCMLIT